MCVFVSCTFPVPLPPVCLLPLCLLDPSRSVLGALSPPSDSRGSLIGWLRRGAGLGDCCDLLVALRSTQTSVSVTATDGGRSRHTTLKIVLYCFYICVNNLFCTYTHGEYLNLADDSRDISSDKEIKGNIGFFSLSPLLPALSFVLFFNRCA